ncbi:Glycerol-3-phosphate ABC transporter, ATP-binding protein UgpC [Labilithrix luteola]|uniref:Glycerol-3-phosphate ABC transporter, ATP-binding protein UgpC n=1 Tax=Labilithrix luteola TaxID=1391654 RepID=A0A0K1PQY0_9BACT|nr:sn-glycerol-3-phosphate ABC transporter ATP-binding protein UgpC [Labilithrix luteola]AKU95932.1 Glycerol-3-phosphate ABC transporter, ATP-binding protein UgpC [Labilithrix luteola]
MSEAIQATRRSPLEQGRGESTKDAPLETPPPALALAERPMRCTARGIKKAFGETSILRGVDLEIPEGSFAVLVGPSGCGKSTLLRLVAGLEEADEGTITLAGRDVTRLPPRDRDIAMVFQSYALYPHLTVRENLAFGLKLRGTETREIQKRIEEASAMLGLDALLDRLPKQLSGGQRQRVAMGRAIVRRPNVFLFDEPLSNLDAALRAEVRVDIRRLHDRLGATTLYVTHDQVEAMTLADTLWVLNKGLVEQKGPPLEVYERPRTKFVATFLGSPKMTMIEGTLVRDAGRTFAEGGGVRALVSDDRFGASLVEGRAVTIGIRPHDVSLAKDGAPSMAELKVELVEALGSEAFAHGWLTQSGPSVIARLDSDDARRVRPGSVIPLAVDPARVHLFDPKTGNALA